MLRNLNVRIIAPPGDVIFSLTADSEPWGAVSVSSSVSLRESETAVKNLSLSVGRSSLAGLSAVVTRAKPRVLSIDSGRGTLALDQLFGWFSSYPAGREYLKAITSLKGIINFSSLRVKGLLAKPSDWEIEIRGKAEKVAVASSFFPSLASASGLFSVEGTRVEVSGLSASLGKSSASGITAQYSWGKKRGFALYSGSAAIVLEELYGWRSYFPRLDEIFKDISEIHGTVTLTSMKGTIPTDGTPWRMAAAGSVHTITVASPLLPGPAAVQGGNFSISGGEISFQDVSALMLDSSISLSGSRPEFPDRTGRSRAFRQGEDSGRDAIRWVFTKFTLPDELIVHPISSLDMHLQWNRASGLSMAGNASISGGPDISIDFSRSPEELVVRRASVKDRDSDASISYSGSGSTIEFAFSGTFAEASMTRIFERSPTSGSGKIQGNLHVKIRADNPPESSARGRLTGQDFVVPSRMAIPLVLNTFLLHADKNSFVIDSAVAIWGESHFSVTGEVSASKNGFIVDLDLENDKVNINKLLDALKTADQGEKEKNISNRESAAGGTERSALSGMIKLGSSSLTYGRYTFSPLNAMVTFGPPGISAAITEAEVCGVSAPGTFSVFNKNVEVEFTPAIRNQPLAYSISCLTGLNVHITGNYDLNADLRMQGKSGSLVSSLEGNVDFTSRNGKIYRAPTLAKIFSVLSVTEIFRGKTPVLGGSGFPYKKLMLKGKLHQGKLRLEQAYITGSSVDLIAEGSVDFASRRMDLVVLVAPFSTINWIIRHIPIVGKLLGGTLVSIPVKVTGDFENPDVIFLDPSVVGSRIVELFKNIVELPVEIISPFFERGKKDNKD